MRIVVSPGSQPKCHWICYLEIIEGVLAQCTALTHLNLSKNYIGNPALAAKLSVLGRCKALVHLDLGYSLISHAAAESLAGVLGQCTALAHLNLRDNDIGSAGTQSLVSILPQCPDWLTSVSSKIEQDQKGQPVLQK